jgi:hypothetical protein
VDDGGITFRHLVIKSWGLLNLHLSLGVRYLDLCIEEVEEYLVVARIARMGQLYDIALLGFVL